MRERPITTPSRLSTLRVLRQSVISRLPPFPGEDIPLPKCGRCSKYTDFHAKLQVLLGNGIRGDQVMDTTQTCVLMALVTGAIAYRND